MSIWTLERQLTYRLEAESREEAVALSYLVEPLDELDTVWPAQRDDTVRTLQLTVEEQSALAQLLHSLGEDDGPLLDLLERLCPTYTAEEEEQ